MSARSIAAALVLGALLAGLAGCATTPARRVKHVPIDARPTPAQPGQPAPAPARHTAPPVAPAPATLRARVGADTLAVWSAVRRCAGRKLLPEQESTLDGLRQQLAQVRAALATGELARAESLARQARSLASSLGCP
jgi:hypothetical protein